MVTSIYWTNQEIDFLINHYIREYDMSKAGPTALLMGGCIDENEFNRICSLPRELRQRETGLLIRDNPGFEDVRKKVLADVRADFQTQNDLSSDDMVSIKNDAIFVIDKVCNATQFGRMTFNVKNVYSSYYRFGRTEMYFYGDTKEVNNKIDVKNIGDDKLVWHKEFMLDFLHYLFSVAQVNPTDCIPVLQQFEQDYLRGEIALGYYREFNTKSAFALKPEFSTYMRFYAEHLPENTDLNTIDINYNLSLLRHLYKIFAGIVLRR